MPANALAMMKQGFSGESVAHFVALALGDLVGEELKHGRTAAVTSGRLAIVKK